MSNYQKSIFSEGSEHHLFLEIDLARDHGLLPGRHLLEAGPENVQTVVGMGAGVLNRVNPQLTPNSLRPFDAIESESHTAPTTQRDLFVWMQGNQRDEVFARGLEWMNTYQNLCTTVHEEHGFIYRDSRDLTGFVDGSANPKDDKRLEAALVPDGQHAGGSFVLTQRWQHDLSKFNQLSVNQQEQVIGRTKADSIELKGEHQPADSHVSRTDIKMDGNPVKIYRRSTPTGGVQNPGLFFLAFSSEITRFQWLLNSMFGQTDDGRQDQLLNYSKPLSGSFYFAPNLRDLDKLFS